MQMIGTKSLANYKNIENVFLNIGIYMMAIMWYNCNGILIFMDTILNESEGT